MSQPRGFTHDAVNLKRKKPPTKAASKYNLKDVTPRDRSYDRHSNGQYGHLRHQVIGETALGVGLCSHDDLHSNGTHEGIRYSGRIDLRQKYIVT